MEHNDGDIGKFCQDYVSILNMREEKEKKEGLL